MAGGLRYNSVDQLPPAWRAQIAAREPRATADAKAKRRGKYNAERVRVDDILFDSKREARHYALLKHRSSAGEIVRFHRQVIFDLPGGITYRCDFQVIEHDGRTRYIDAKGVRTKEFNIKRRLVRAAYGVEIELV